MPSTTEIPYVIGPAPAMSIGRVLEAQAAHCPDAVAIAAPGCSPLTYRGLRRHVNEIVGHLNSRGVGRTDCVAVALPNGPQMATAFLATTAAAICAPLNPAYTAAEFDFYLSDLGAKAVIVPAGSDSPVIAVAKARGVAILEISPPRAEAGLFELEGRTNSFAAQSGLGEAGEVALVLHTSGTTSRPKMIPLSHANLCTSARNIQASLRLGADDRCLNVMPLFHIHGLIGALLSSLTSGASVVCTTGFSPVNFFQWIDEFCPTWYTAVPTMHQEVLARAAANEETIARRRLRFIRSCSAPLPPRIMTQLERVFDAPVIEAYGMTEGSHQIASNPLPPEPRKAGSVGLPTGPQVAILDGADHPLPRGESGEIAIRGANVTSGAPGSPGAERGSAGWFRTGDIGFLDSDGYLFISGRVKEIINRGGEKISPREVDEAMLEHPAVAQAVTASFPDSRLGEEVFAAVVLRPGVALSERELRQFVAGRLAPFKVPRRVIFVQEVPKGPTGKIQRIGLAARLGIDSLKLQPIEAGTFVAPRTETETTLAEIWMDLLRLDRISVDDNFFELGGDSLASVEVVIQVEERLGVTVNVDNLAFGTLRQVAASCEESVKSVNHAERRPVRDGDKNADNGRNEMRIGTHLRTLKRELLQAATRPLAKRWPIESESYPGWLGRLHNLRVPRNVRPNVQMSPGGGANVRIIYRLLEPTLSLEGDIAECGVFQGSTLIPIGLFARRRSPKHVLGFDSFEGLDETVKLDMGLSGGEDDRKTIGGFSDASYEQLVVRIRQFDLDSTVRAVKGYFRDTLERYANRRFCFVHLDCVIYESYKQCLEFFYPRLVKGGIILLDEYRDPPWPGCTRAVDEFVADKAEKLVEIASDNQVRFYLRKL